MQVYVPIWTFTDWISSDTETIGVYRDVGSAFRALIKKGIEAEYILNETNTYDTPEKFASFLYEKYIAVEEGNLENMNVGLENLRWDCGTSDFHERFLGCVCANQFQ
jgi:hypothetical protein